ncbi:GDYXXLXY domain-containing protein [Psychrobacter alimentarius]|uniref:GDYXXLXY domain-containing protein n=1 Tax=Psychrobacter alimentarius TaxID=261164 RepID=UPI00191AC5D5|nr:GDYXXLXY domain-containing protein [Psychrobacter alimentarius]
MNDANKRTDANNTFTSSLASRQIAWWQKPAVSITIAVLGLVGVLTFVSMNVTKYETHLASGAPVLLQLAPVDPRGFMQGDYMALSYALERDILDALDKTVDRPKSADGYVIVALDEHDVGHFVRLADSYQPNTLAANEKAIHYRLRNGSVKLATNAFFFQEGHANAFEAAEYGLFRVNDKGDPLLTNLVNETFGVIDPTATDKAKVNN